MTDGRPRRRATRRIAYGVGAVFALLIVLAALAPVMIRGTRFGTVVGWMLPPTRGTITLAGGRWGWGAVWALVRGRAAPLSLDGVRVTDPEGTEVLRAAHITGAVELTRDHTRLVLHDLRVSDGAWRFATMKGARDVGFLAAFQSAPRKPAARPRKAGGGLSAFVIAGAELDDLDTTFDLPAWGLSLPRVHARGSLALGAEPSQSASASANPPRATFTFEVTDADLRGGGLLRVLNGRARVELPFSAGRIARVATTAAAPDALQIQASDVATGRSRLALAGSFTGIYGASRPRQPAGIDLHARVTDAADAARAVWARRSPPILAGVSVAGRGADLQLTFTGPLDRPTISAAARGFDLGLRDLAFNGVGFDLTVQPATARARVAGLTFTSPGGGRLTLDAEVDSLLVRGALALDRFSTAPYLPGFLRPLVGGVLDGRLRGALDLVGRSASLDELALTLARPPGGGGPRTLRRLRFTSAAPGDAHAHPSTRASDHPPIAPGTETLRISGARFAHGTLILPTVSGAFAGGQISARARIVLTDAAGRLRPPVFDVDVRARRISVTRLIGTSFASGVFSVGAHARGTLDDLDVDIQVPADQTLRVFGEPCHLPKSTVLHLDEQGLAIPDFRLRGTDEAELVIGGRISRAGQLALTLDLRAFPLGKLPVLAEAALPFSGQVLGRLRASGPALAPRLEGEMAIERAAFRGRPLGGGRLTITPRPQGAIHGAGQVVEGISLDGMLTPRGDGVHAVATLQLRDARLDPFLPIPARAGGLKASGTVSGTLEARIAPGQPPSLDGRLTALAMAVTGPMQLLPGLGKRATATPTRTTTPTPTPTGKTQTIELHAVSEVRLSARAGGGPVRVEPARFASTLGTIELWGESADGRAHAGARGRLLLAPAAALTGPWLSRVAGALDFEVAADTAVGRGAAPPVVTGTVRVAAPLAFRLAGLPFDARVASGELRLAGDGIARVDLPVTLGSGTLRLAGTITAPPLTGAAPHMALDLAGELDAQLLALMAPGAVASAQGRARLDAHLEGRPARPTLRARLRPGGVTLALRALPALPIAIGGGAIDLDDHAMTVRDLHVRVGRGGGLAGGAGPKIDAAIDVIVGGTADGAATLEMGSTLDPRPARVALPVRGQVNAIPVAPVVIDDASFALRLDGDLSRSARLAGEITIVKAHVPRQRAKAPTAAPTAAASSASPSWRSRPELARVALDIAAHSSGGAVTVEVPHLPDVTVDVDYRVRGTAAKPQVSGHFEGADLWSSFALLLRRIFQ